jgi:hypothetical protein
MVTALAIATLLITTAKIDETATEPHFPKHAQDEPKKRGTSSDHVIKSMQLNIQTDKY